MAVSLQELVVRLGRNLDDRSGPGRTPLSLGRATEIRLVGIRKGSTKLDIEIGDPNTVDLPEETHALLAGRFEEIMHQIGDNVAPPWADHLIGEATYSVVRSLQMLGAEEIRLTRTEGDTAEIVRIETQRLDAEVWEIEALATLEQIGNEVRASGFLEAVDLGSGKFRIRDDAGRAIRLENVGDASHVGKLVGGRVVASGAGFRDSRGRLSKIENAQVEAHDFAGRADDVVLGRPRQSVAGADFGFSDDDLESFLRELRS